MAGLAVAGFTTAGLAIAFLTVSWAKPMLILPKKTIIKTQVLKIKLFFIKVKISVQIVLETRFYCFCCKILRLSEDECKVSYVILLVMVILAA
jgi:hypothetical protein